MKENILYVERERVIKKTSLSLVFLIACLLVCIHSLYVLLFQRIYLWNSVEKSLIRFLELHIEQYKVLYFNW